MLLDPDYITTLLAQVGTAATFVLILGIIAVTGEKSLGRAHLCT